MSKTWFTCFLMMVFIAGTACFWDIDPSVSCPDPNDPQCKHLLKDVDSLIPFNESDMPRYCSNMDDYYKCIDDNYTAEKLCGRPLIMKSLETMVGEFCSKRTTLHKRFFATIECIKKILNLASGICQNSALSAMRTLKAIPGSTVFQINKRLERCLYLMVKNKGLERSISPVELNSNIIVCRLKGHQLLEEFGFNGIKTWEMECYGTQTIAACGTDSQTLYKEIVMRSSYYTADCRDYQQYYKALEALMFLSQHSALQTLRYPGDSLSSKLM